MKKKMVKWLFYVKFSFPCLDTQWFRDYLTIRSYVVLDQTIYGMNLFNVSFDIL